MMKSIKVQFMAYRNGIVADALRSAGMNCYNVIFGLNVPQLAQIAGTVGQDKAIALELWADKKVRESRLLATYIFPPEEVSEQEALALMTDTQTQEEANMLAFRLLRRLPYLDSLKAQATAYAATALDLY
ncbi:MAG: hypothetical protein NC217_03400 [Muribaculaceae bacterium]|nr:hypothetical protein [Muribaculaceae bacterium]